MNIKIVIISLLMLFAGSISAQNWTKLDYNPDQAGLEYNPLKGFMTLWNPSTSFPRSIEGKNFGLDELMTGMESFNWTAIDNFIRKNASNGNFSSIQVIIDPANGKTNMPAFLKDQVDWKTKPSSLCPDWNNEILMQAMLKFIAAYGERYDKDSRVFLVTLGLYGMWGEWHVGSDKTFDMTQANKTRLANAYKKAFPGMNLMARYADAVPDPQAFGYSDGLFFSHSISPNPEDRWHFHNMLKIDHADQNWKQHPIGGEIDPDLQSTIWKSWPNTVGQDVTQSLDSIHPTFLICHYLFEKASPETEEWNNAIRVQKMLGYTFFVNQYRLTAADSIATIELGIQNKGIAPLYANWDLEIAVIDSSNQFQSIGITKCNIENIQPGNTDNYRAIKASTKISDGTYKVVMRIINPLEQFSSKAKPVRFANTTQDADTTGWLTLGEMTILAGVCGGTPVRVSELTMSPETSTLSVGDTLRLSANVLPVNASRKNITWSSDHPATASVDSNGVVTAGPVVGQATISAVTQDGCFEAKSTITTEPIWITIPGKVEAEDFIHQSGVQTEYCNDIGRGLNVGWINDGDWMQYAINNTGDSNSFSVSFRLAAPGNEALISVYLDTIQIGEIVIPKTGSWQNWRSVVSNLTIGKGKHYLKLVAVSGDYNVNYVDFQLATSTDINQSKNDDIIIYPSPASTSITIKSGDWQFNKVDIIDVMGKIVFSKELISQSTTNLPININSGIYIVKLSGRDKTILKKIIVEE